MVAGLALAPFPDEGAPASWPVVPPLLPVLLLATPPLLLPLEPPELPLLPPLPLPLDPLELPLLLPLPLDPLELPLPLLLPPVSGDPASVGAPASSGDSVIWV